VRSYRSLIDQIGTVIGRKCHDTKPFAVQFKQSGLAMADRIRLQAVTLRHGFGMDQGQTCLCIAPRSQRSNDLGHRRIKMDLARQIATIPSTASIADKATEPPSTDHRQPPEADLIP